MPDKPKTKNTLWWFCIGMNPKGKPLVLEEIVWYMESPIKTLLPQGREDQDHLRAVRSICCTAKGIADGILAHFVENLRVISLKLHSANQQEHSGSSPLSLSFSRFLLHGYLSVKY